jgi:hypothetical protein
MDDRSCAPVGAKSEQKFWVSVKPKEMPLVLVDAINHLPERCKAMYIQW